MYEDGEELIFSSLLVMPVAEGIGENECKDRDSAR
jgi:hypothetical protein